MTFKGWDALQRVLDKLEHWAMINGMKCIKSKCLPLHLGWSKARHKCKTGREVLGEQPAQRDLGVLFGSRGQAHSWLTGVTMCALAARRANPILGCSQPTMSCLSKEASLSILCVCVLKYVFIIVWKFQFPLIFTMSPLFSV